MKAQSTLAQRTDLFPFHDRRPPSQPPSGPAPPRTKKVRTAAKLQPLERAPDAGELSARAVSHLFEGEGTTGGSGENRNDDSYIPMDLWNRLALDGKIVDPQRTSSDRTLEQGNGPSMPDLASNVHFSVSSELMAPSRTVQPFHNVRKRQYVSEKLSNLLSQASAQFYSRGTKPVEPRDEVHANMCKIGHACGYNRSRTARGRPSLSRSRTHACTHARTRVHVRMHGYMHARTGHACAYTCRTRALRSFRRMRCRGYAHTCRRWSACMGHGAGRRGGTKCSCCPRLTKPCCRIWSSRSR